MQPLQLWFSIPGFGRPRPAERRGEAGSKPGDRTGAWRRWPTWRPRVPQVRPPALGSGLLGGLVACLLVLVPGVLAAELLAWGYEARLAEDARVRATAGLDAAAGLV